MLEKEKEKELGSHWEEVLELAQQCGFLKYVYGDTALLQKNNVQQKEENIPGQVTLFDLGMEG